MLALLLRHLPGISRLDGGDRRDDLLPKMLMLMQRSWYRAWSRARRRFHRPRRPLDPGRGHGGSIMLLLGKTCMLLLLLLRSIKPDHRRGPPPSSSDCERPPALPLSRPRVLRVEAAPRHPLQPLVGGGPELRGHVPYAAGGGGGAPTHSTFPHGHNCRLIYLFILGERSHANLQSVHKNSLLHFFCVSAPFFASLPSADWGFRIREGGLLYSGGMCVSLAASVFKGALLLMAAVVVWKRTSATLHSFLERREGGKETNKSSKLRASLSPPLIPRSPSSCGPLVHILAAALSGGGAGGGGGDGKYDIFSIFSSSSSVCVRPRLVSCLEGRFEEHTHTPRSSTNSHPHVFDNFLLLLLLPSIVGGQKGD